jgi:hypothetical protein
MQVGRPALDGMSASSRVPEIRPFSELHRQTDCVTINAMNAERAQELLKTALGEDAEFRPGQLEAILPLWMTTPGCS